MVLSSSLLSLAMVISLSSIVWVRRRMSASILRFSLSNRNIAVRQVVSAAALSCRSQCLILLSPVGVWLPSLLPHQFRVYLYTCQAFIFTVREKSLTRA